MTKMLATKGPEQPTREVRVGSIRRTPSGGYEARYRDPHGRQRGKAFRRKSDAVRFLATIESDKQRGAWTDPRSGKISFADFATRWLETTVHLKPSTRASYEMLLRRHVFPYFGPFRVGNIERTHVQSWLSGLASDGVGAGTARNAYSILCRVLSEAASAKLITTNPALGIPVPRSTRQEMRFLTPLEISRLADAVIPQFRVLILVAGYTGLRWGEIAALRVDRLDLLRGSIEIRESVSEVGGHLRRHATKTGARRTVPLPRFLRDALAQHLEAHAGTDGAVFTSPAGGPLRHQNFYRRHFKPALSRAGLDATIRFHDLRHSAASIAINSGANVLQVQQMLGHSSAVMTLDTYGHVFPALAEQLRSNLDAAYEEAKANGDVVETWCARPKSIVRLPAAAGRKHSTPAKTHSWGRLDSNQRPTDYESAALTN
jgi:integrase